MQAHSARAPICYPVHPPVVRPVPRPAQPARRYSHAPRERYAPFQFTREKAARLFHEKDKKRLFAPLECELKQTQIPGIVPFNDPIRKEYLLFCFSKAQIKGYKFTFRHGYNQQKIVRRDGRVEIEQWIQWRNGKGEVGDCSYDEQSEGSGISGQIKPYPHDLVEKALDRFDFEHLLLPLDIPKMEKEAALPKAKHLRKAALVRDFARARIDALEEERCLRAARELEPMAHHHEILYVRPAYEELSIDWYYLPVFSLHYPGQPARIMSATNSNTSGGGDISIIKSMGLGAVLGVGASFFIPGGIFIRLLTPIAGAIGSALMGPLVRNIQYRFHKSSMRSDKKANESVAESVSDKMRRKRIGMGHQSETIEEPVSEASIGKTEGKILHVAKIYFDTLGLDPQTPVTRESVQRAHRKMALKYHPDKGGSSEKMQSLNDARDVMLTRLGKPGASKRHYSTAAPVKVKLPPRSTFDPMARQLIDAVLIEKNYKKAKVLVYEKDVPVDAHDVGENTLLTEAAKKGDLGAVKFALGELEASPDTSCDCPKHRTALHYAAKAGREDIVAELLEHGAHPNLIDSDGNTAMDVAINAQTVAVLNKHGGVRNDDRSVWKKIAGYSSDERTILVEGQGNKVPVRKK